MANYSEFNAALELLSQNNEKSRNLLNSLAEDLSLPNFPMQTMGGNTWWNTLVEVNGWRLQENMFTHHARILNSGDVRVAWGSTEAMFKALRKLTISQSNYSNAVSSSQNTYDSSDKNSFDDNVEKLKKLKELFDLGIISETEYNTKRNALISKL